MCVTSKDLNILENPHKESKKVLKNLGRQVYQYLEPLKTQNAHWTYKKQQNFYEAT